MSRGTDTRSRVPAVPRVRLSRPHNTNHPGRVSSNDRQFVYKKSECQRSAGGSDLVARREEGAGGGGGAG